MTLLFWLILAPGADQEHVPGLLGAGGISLNSPPIFRGWHFIISWGPDASPREPDAGLSSGELRAPELKAASGADERVF